MDKPTKDLTHQMAIRMEPELRAMLEADAKANGRTVAQSVRHLVRQGLQAANGPCSCGGLLTGPEVVHAGLSCWAP